MNDLKEVLRAVREERYATAEVMLMEIMGRKLKVIKALREERYATAEVMLIKILDRKLKVLRALREERYATAEVMLTKILDSDWVEAIVDEIRKIANDNLSKVDPVEMDFAFALELLIREKNE